MKKSFVILFALCCLETTAISQDKDHYMVRAGQEASAVIPRCQHFYYNEFQQGQVFYPQGKRSDIMMLNYNTLLQVMQYIDNNGDTLFIPEESNIFKYVRIGKDIFYHHFKEGYFNLYTRNDQFNLATRTRWKIARRDMMVYNGYGMSSVSPGSTLSERREGDSVVPNEDVAYVNESDFYVVGPRDVVFRANRGGILKAYPENKEQILEYMHEHQTNFESQESLMGLVEYGNSLLKAQQASVAYKPKGN
jgi:hypothetical protein